VQYPYVLGRENTEGENIAAFSRERLAFNTEFARFVQLKNLPDKE
jgi:hypothetical protein